MHWYYSRLSFTDIEQHQCRKKLNYYLPLAPGSGEQHSGLDEDAHVQDEVTHDHQYQHIDNAVSNKE